MPSLENSSLAALRQVLHQVQVEGQLRKVQALEQRQHIAAFAGGREIVGVLDAAFNAAQFGELAQMQVLHEALRLVDGYFGENGHGSVESVVWQVERQGNGLRKPKVFTHDSVAKSDRFTLG